MSDKKIEINVLNDERSVLIVSIALVLITLIIAPLIYSNSKNHLIKSSDSCYSKVLLENWTSDAAEIMALHACNDSIIADEN